MKYIVIYKPTYSNKKCIIGFTNSMESFLEYNAKKGPMKVPLKEENLELKEITESCFMPLTFRHTYDVPDFLNLEDEKK